MAAAQLRVSISEARVRLQALAYADERALLDIAQDLIARRIRIAPD